MRLLFIRHGDPDYSIDSLTPYGMKEAEALAEMLKNEKIDYMYCSPLGRERALSTAVRPKRSIATSAMRRYLFFPR